MKLILLVENLTLDSAGGTVLVDDELVVTNDIRVNGNDIKASDGNTNITLTSNTLTTVAGDLQVNGLDIKASDGTTAITVDTNGGATIAQNMTVHWRFVCKRIYNSGQYCFNVS